MSQTTNNRKNVYNPFDLFMHFQDHKQSTAYRMNFLLYMAIFAIIVHIVLVSVLAASFPGRQGLLVVFAFIAGALLSVYIWRINAMRFVSVGNGHSGRRLAAYVFALFMIYSIAVMGTWLIIPEVHRLWLIPIGIATILMLTEWIMARMFWMVYGLLILGFWLLRMEASTNSILIVSIWIGVLAAMMFFLPQNLWMIEIERGQIYYYRPYYASKQNTRLLNRPASPLTPALREKLEKWVSRETIDQYIAYSAPKASEKTIRSQLETKLHDAYLNYVIHTWRQRGADPISDEVNRLDRAYQEQLISNYCPPEVQVKIRREAESVIQEFLNLWDKSAYDPVVWINPRDYIGHFWSWGSPIPISLSLDKVVTKSESIVKIVLNFVVLPDPNILMDTQAFANFAETSDKTALINSVKGAFTGNADRKTREFFLTKSPFEISTLECLTEFRNYLANHALEGVEKMMGVMVLAPTVQYTLLIADEIERASVESHVERIQSDVWAQILKKVGASNEDIRNFIFARGVLKHTDKADRLDIDGIIPNHGYTTLTPTDEIVPPQPTKPHLPPSTEQAKFPPQTLPPSTPPPIAPAEKGNDDNVIEGKFVDIDDYDD